MAMTNVLDLMTKKDRDAMMARYKRRMEKRDNGEDNRISSEIYIVAEFGYYFGWLGIAAIRNNEITIEEVFGLLEGARKVWYSKLVDQARAQQVSTASVLAKSPNTAFKRGIKPFVKRSEVT